MAIGQGQVSVTPASLAMMITTVANGGTRVTPHLVRAVDEGGGWKMAKPPVVAERVAFRPDDAGRAARRPLDGGERLRVPAAARAFPGVTSRARRGRRR